MRHFVFPSNLKGVKLSGFPRAAPRRLAKLKFLRVNPLIPITMPLADISQYVFGPIIFLLSLFMVLLILVQRGRGGGLVGALGGAGGQSAFGTKAGDLFTRITVVTAGIWIFLLGFAVWWYTEKDLGAALPDTTSNATSSIGPATTPATSGSTSAATGSETPAPAMTLPADAKGEISDKDLPTTTDTAVETKPAGDTPAPEGPKPSTEAKSETPKSEPDTTKPTAETTKSAETPEKPATEPEKPAATEKPATPAAPEAGDKK